MFWKTNLLWSAAFTALLLSCTEKKSSHDASGHLPQYLAHSTLIELSEIENYSSIVFIDLRKPEQYSTGHIPDAISLNRVDFQRMDLPYHGMAPSREEMGQLLGLRGIKPTDFLVLYDDAGGVEASRLWWILKMYGHESVRILNGGLYAWKGNLQIGTQKRSPTQYQFTGNEVTDMFIGYEAFEQWRKRPGIKLLDCRSKSEYEGAYIKEGAWMAGHIDDATNICYSRTISMENGMKIKSKQALAEIYSDFAQPSDTILVYCHSGVRSAHVLMVLKEILDYEHVYNYDGSWVEWTYFHQNRSS